MGKSSYVHIQHKRALNQALIYARHAPISILHEPSAFLRALRRAPRMSQEQLARRCKVPQAQISLIERRRADVRLGTLRRLFEAMFCDLLILPRARKRPGDALAERELERSGRRIWDDYRNAAPTPY